MGEDCACVGHKDETDPDLRSVAKAAGYSERTETRLEKDPRTGEGLGEFPGVRETLGA